jgi:hypothetical protein
MPSTSRFRGAILPVVIVVIGLLLLLNTLDVIAWTVWPRLSRLWPVLVIAFGIDLLWRHFRRPPA